MSVKKRKTRTKRRKETGRSLSVVFIAIFIVVVLAVAVYFFFFSVEQPTSKQKETRVVRTEKTTVKPAKMVSHMLDGSWVSSSDGRILEIHGSHFTLELPSVSDHELVRGTLQFSGNTVSVLYTNTKDKCSHTPGIYTFKKENNKVYFRVKQDLCAGRKQIFSTTWEKF